jgi:AraC family transcriptional regulator of adaptative response/methylated-DNA-[protein]-cysteine methyltransferase
MTTLIDRPKAPGVSEEARYWQAVLTRDRSFDGVFVYGVTSIMIYCRPICPSRRPQRANTVCFSGPVAAELEGFRPCRRCRPGQGSLDQPQIEMVLKA